MKKNICLTKVVFNKWLCILLLLFIGVNTMTATSTYYYNVQAKAYDGTNNRTGGGTVYVGTSQSDLPTGTEWVWVGFLNGGYKEVPFNNYSQDNNQNGSAYGPENSSAANTFYYYAVADNDYFFSHWVDDNPQSTTVLSRNEQFSLRRTFNSTSSSDRTKFLTYAIFKKQTGKIKVRNSDGTKGSVSIDNPDNVTGDVVTITATPDDTHGIRFLGWKKNNQDGDEDGYYSKNNPLTLTVSNETEGTYWAYFSDPVTTLYCRIKNNKTDNFLSIYGDKTKKATKTQSSLSGISKDTGFNFTNCMKMISAEEAQGNPMTVFSRIGENKTQGVVAAADLSAQGVSYSDYVQSTDNYQLNMETSNGVTRIYAEITITVGMLSQVVRSYLCDDGSGWLVMKPIDTESDEVKQSAEWTVYYLDETSTKGAFGANTKEKFKKGNKFYTTMYTDFAYQMLDEGMNAYYLIGSEDYYDRENNIVKFAKLDSKLVPARFPVVIETAVTQNSASQEEVNNRLLPLPKNVVVPSPLKQGESAVLQGYLSYNGLSEDGKTPKTNDKSYMYVLSSKNGVLGFYHSSKETMTPNKAYLDISLYSTSSEITNLAKTAKFSFGEPEVTGIELSNQMVDEDDSTPVYNLNGTKVAEGKAAENMLRPGVYVKKGKKFVVK